MLSDPDYPQALEQHAQFKTGKNTQPSQAGSYMEARPLTSNSSLRMCVREGERQRSPGVDPNQLAAELQKVSQQQGPGVPGSGVGPGGMGVLSALERSALLHSGAGSGTSSGVPSPGQPASPAINKKQRHSAKVTDLALSSSLYT